MQLITLAVLSLLSLSSSVVAKRLKKLPVKDKASFTAGYYPSYNAQVQPITAVPFAKYDVAFWFVAEPQKDGTIDFGGSSDSDIQQFIKLAQGNNTKTSLTVGGWTGSRFISTLVSSDSSRQAFAKTLLAAVKKYGFDGVDLDWEAPGEQGIGCNVVDKANDASNYAAFFTLLRQMGGPNLLLSAALSSGGISGASDYKEMGKAVDFVTLMTYDTYGGWSKISGPNDPLRSTCNTDDTSASVQAAVQLYTSGGFPASKILIGAPQYAYAYTTTSSSLTKRVVNGQSSLLFQETTGVAPDTDKLSAIEPGSKDICGNPNVPAGQWLFNELISTGKLSKDATKGQGGWTRHFDTCTQTPFLFNPDTKNLISYDDPTSIKAKLDFAKANGLKGLSFFDTSGDSDDDLLLDAANGGLIPVTVAASKQRRWIKSQVARELAVTSAKPTALRHQRAFRSVLHGKRRL